MAVVLEVSSPPPPPPPPPPPLGNKEDGEGRGGSGVEVEREERAEGRLEMGKDGMGSGSGSASGSGLGMGLGLGGLRRGSVGFMEQGPGPGRREGEGRGMGGCCSNPGCEAGKAAGMEEDLKNNSEMKNGMEGNGLAAPMQAGLTVDITSASAFEAALQIVEFVRGPGG